jgi:hypothetical protein
VIAYSAGGDERNQLRSRDICIEPDMMFENKAPLHSRFRDESRGEGDGAETGCVKKAKTCG